MTVQPGDVLFTDVFLDANEMPDELMLQLTMSRLTDPAETSKKENLTPDRLLLMLKLTLLVI